MVKLTGKLLLLWLLIGLASVDRVEGEIYPHLKDRRIPAVTIPRVTHDRVAGTGECSQGFRTTHIVVPTPTLTPYDSLIEQFETRSEVPAELVRTVVQVESGFDPAARSSVGTMGLMQLMPETAAELGVADPYDPVDNLRGGITYLKRLLDQYDGNEEIALAAYNAGPGAVERYGNRVPPFPETRNYVRTVRSATDAAARLPRIARDGTLYKGYAVVDGWWTAVLSNVPPSSWHYSVTAETT
jgi:hypothetical protein